MKVFDYIGASAPSFLSVHKNSPVFRSIISFSSHLFLTGAQLFDSKSNSSAIFFNISAFFSRKDSGSSVACLTSVPSYSFPGALPRG